MKFISKDILHDLYINQKFTIIKIAQILEVSRDTISDRLELYGIPKQNQIKIKNKTGEKHGQLTVLGYAYKKNNKHFWRCECFCGKIKILERDHLAKVKSCGCLEKKVFYAGPGYINGQEFSTIRTRARSKKREFNIHIKDLDNLYDKQNRKCRLSGRDISFNIGSWGSPNFVRGDASVDRIDSSKGYTVDNIQIVHKDINVAKMDMTQYDFIKMCKEIAEYNK